MKPIHPDVDQFLASMEEAQGIKAAQVAWVVLDQTMALYPLAMNCRLPGEQVGQLATFLTMQVSFLSAQYQGLDLALVEDVVTQAIEFGRQLADNAYPGCYSPMTGMPSIGEEKNLH